MDSKWSTNWPLFSSPSFWSNNFFVLIIEIWSQALQYLKLTFNLSAILKYRDYIILDSAKVLGAYIHFWNYYFGISIGQQFDTKRSKKKNHFFFYLSHDKHENEILFYPKYSRLHFILHTLIMKTSFFFLLINIIHNWYEI